MSTFKSVVTTLGQARIAAAIAAGTDINITQLAVGDGNGKATTPVASQTKLVKEVYRTPLNSLKLDPTHGNWVIAEAVISASVGGFWMREMGLFSSDGALIAVCNMADTYKPTLAEGSGRTQTLRMVIAVSNTEAISLLIDDSVIMATEQYVNDLLAAHEKSRNHPDGTTTAKGFVQLSSSVASTSEALAATPKAVKAVNDNANSRVPSTRKINGKALSADQTLTAADVGAVSNTLTNVDNATVKKIYDPSIVALTGGVTLAGYFDDHPLGATFQAADTLMTYRRWYDAGAALTQYLHCTNGTIYERLGVVSKTDPTGWQWRKSDGVLPFGWRKVYDSANPPTAFEVGSINVATTLLNSTDINTLGFASGTPGATVYAQNKNASATPALHYPEKTAGTLYVMPSAYGCQQTYVTFTGNTWNRGLSGDWNGVDGPWKEWVPTYGANNKPTAADVGALASTGGVVTGEIKGTSAVFSGSLTQRENIVGYRQLISRADAFSAYTTYNRLDQVEGMRPGSVIAVGDIAARLTTAAGDPYGRILAGVSFQYNTTGGGRLVLNARNDAGVVKSAITLDGDSGNATFAGDTEFKGLVRFSRHDGACEFSSSDAAYPLISVNYSGAGNFGFWDTTNGRWILRKRASNVTNGTADNWVMDGGLEVTGAYGLTLTTALPISSGGTGAKTATDALKNLGGLPSNGTAVAATKLATARKIAGVAFDGTKDISISAGNVDALPSGGTAVAATKLATARKIAGVAFDGTKDINLTNSNVGLGNVGNFAAVQQGGGVGMGTNKIYIGWTGAKIKIQVDASDMGEVYTTQNKPPFVDSYSKTESNAHYIARDSVKTAGFASGNVANPYMRHEASDAVVYLADRNWSDSRFVYDVQRGSQALENAGWTAQQNWEAPTGCFMTGLNIRPDMGDCRMMGKYYRALMIKTASGSWRQVGN